MAKIQNKDPMDALFDLLIEDNAATGVAVFGMSEPDVVLALQQPWVSFDNDSSGASPEGILGQEHPHPRAYGTFPRILRKYVREEKKLTLEDAIRKCSALPAQRMRLTDRGVLKAGMWADIVVFDPATVRDVATFENPNQLSQGMEYVLVNGVSVIDQGKDDWSAAGKSAARAGLWPRDSSIRYCYHMQVLLLCNRDLVQSDRRCVNPPGRANRESIPRSGYFGFKYFSTNNFQTQTAGRPRHRVKPSPHAQYLLHVLRGRGPLLPRRAGR